VHIPNPSARPQSCGPSRQSPLTFHEHDKDEVAQSKLVKNQHVVCGEAALSCEKLAKPPNRSFRQACSITQWRLAKRVAKGNSHTLDLIRP